MLHLSTYLTFPTSPTGWNLGRPTLSSWGSQHLWKSKVRGLWAIDTSTILLPFQSQIAIFEATVPTIPMYTYYIFIYLYIYIIYNFIQQKWKLKLLRINCCFASTAAPDLIPRWVSVRSMASVNRPSFLRVVAVSYHQDPSSVFMCFSGTNHVHFISFQKQIK